MPKPEKNTVMRAAMLLMLVQVLSRILGYAREVLLLNVIGPGYETDSFNAAFRIPDFFYNILIGGAISAALIPVFSYYLAREDKREAWHLSSIFTTWGMMLMLICCAFAFAFAEPLMQMLTSFSPDELALPVTLMRITLLQSLFMAMSAIATGILQSFRHFTWPAIGNLLYNIFIILGGLLLIGPIERLWPGYGVAGFSIGVVVGAAATLFVQVPMLKKYGYQYHPVLDVHHPGLHQIVRLMAPVLIGLSVSQINVFVTQILATGISDGVYSLMMTANRFFQLPYGVFALSISTALFPTMTALYAAGEMDEMKKHLSLGLRNTLFIIMPCAVGLILLREPIIRLLYEFSGKFTAADTQIAGEALLFYCLGLGGYAATMPLLRAFYAMQNTLTPLLISVAAILINILFSLLFAGPWAHIGLALANSISLTLQALLLFYFLRRRIGRMDGRHILLSLGKTMLACAAMAVVVWAAAAGVSATIGVDSKFGQLLQVCLAMVAGALAFFLASHLMKMEELQAALDIFHRRMRRKKTAAN